MKFSKFKQVLYDQHYLHVMDLRKNTRLSKTTRRQYEIYLNELRTNKPFRENKFDGSDPDIIQRTWQNLVSKLNASGGPVRDITGWKRVTF